MSHVLVSSIVAARDAKPYVQLSIESGSMAQLSIAEARHIAMDILQLAARAEADAIIWKFFKKEGFPQGAGEALMGMFRDFRAQLDAESVESSMSDPETGEQV
jgi:hypothetical protein